MNYTRLEMYLSYRDDESKQMVSINNMIISYGTIEIDSSTKEGTKADTRLCFELMINEKKVVLFHIASFLHM